MDGRLGECVLAAMQVDAVLQHMAEPLMSLHVGGLSRSLYPNPRQLAANGERNAQHLPRRPPPAPQPLKHQTHQPPAISSLNQ